MICPHCHTQIGPDSAARNPRACPECGAQLYSTVTGFLKTSAVMISADGEEGFYHSVREVPEPLRRRLMESTASENSGTIVIADRAGKEQLTQVLGRRQAAGRGTASAAAPDSDRAAEAALEDALENAFEDALEAGLPDTPLAVQSDQPLARSNVKRLAWIGFFIVIALGAAFAAFFGMRF